MGDTAGSRITRAEVIVALVALVIIAALLVPGLLRSKMVEERQVCANNLRQLWKMERIYLTKAGSRLLIYPMQEGGDFWLHLNLGKIQLIEDDAIYLFSCPSSGRYPVKGSTDYLGPPVNIALLAGFDEWIGGDMLDNHGPGGSGGGNAINRRGDIFYLLPTEFRAAAAKCKK